MQPKAPPPGFKVYDGTAPSNGNGAAAAPLSRPVPLVGQTERSDYPLGALPEVIRGAVSDVIDAVQAAPEMVASSALAVASLAAQSMADVRRSEALTGPCLEHRGGVVGEADLDATGKSSAKSPTLAGCCRKASSSGYRIPPGRRLPSRKFDGNAARPRAAPFAASAGR
jgi:hypothetical protein